MTINFALVNTALAEIMIFVGDGCPHCANVEQYMEENNISARLPTKYYEVWYHPENQVIYTQKAQEVGYTGGGVPLLVDGARFEIGDSNIISYLSGLLEKQNEKSAEVLKKDAQPITAQPEAQKITAQQTPQEKSGVNLENLPGQTEFTGNDETESKYNPNIVSITQFLFPSLYVYLGTAILIFILVAIILRNYRKKRS